MEPSAVSHQLRVLRHLGLVVGRRDGRSIVYDLYDDHVGELLEQAIGHVEHLRLGRSRSAPAAALRRHERDRHESRRPGAEVQHDHDHDDHHDTTTVIRTGWLTRRSSARAREYERCSSLSAVLGLAAVAQAVIFVLSGSVALLADLIHNFGDALTAVPLGIAFVMRSERAERTAGLFVVAAIFISACVAGVEAIQRLIHPSPPTHLWALAAAGAIGYIGNFIAARVRSGAGRRLDSPALIADGNHAAADAYVSLAVVASAIVVALGAPIADPLIGLAITLVILRITWQSWNTVRGRGHHHH